MATAKQDAQWINIDVSTLTTAQSAAYRGYKQCYLEMKQQREAFELLMSADVPSGERMIFGYNFGKLSVAIVLDDRKPKSAKAAPQSLADYLASRKDAGQQC